MNGGKNMLNEVIQFDSPTAEALAVELESLIKKSHPDIEMSKGAVVKINDVWKNAVTIRDAGQALAPTLYLDSVVDAIEAGEISIQEAAENLCKTYEIGIMDMPTMRIMDRFNKDNLYAVVVNAESNKEKLANCPHMNIPNTDLAVMCRISMGDNASVLVTNEMCSMLEATPSEVVDRALRNVSAIDNWQVRSMQDVLIESMGILEELAEDFGLTDAPEMLVISDKSNMSALGPFVNEELRAEIANRLRCEDGEGYYIIPSSRFETIAIRADMDWKSVEEMVSEVNATQVDKEDQLSDHVYKVDGETLRISIAGQNENITKTLSSTEKISPSMKI